ncbi:MAG: class I SAM-dependent methyltransferase [Sphingomonadaceae bacterium]
MTAPPPPVDFGRTATDYGRHRAGFPSAFFDALLAQLSIGPGWQALDIGTGTGTIARGLARLGLAVNGLDPARPLLDEAARLAAQEGLAIDWHEATAEQLPFPDASFDLVTAGQCWHWFDRPRAAAEARRVLRPGQPIVIAHFDWLPLPGNVVQMTEALIEEANPAWRMGGGTGLYPAWLTDLATAGFTDIRTASFDIAQPYSAEAWRGRIQASAGVRASLSAEAAQEFDTRLARLLAQRFPADPIDVPHRVWWVTAHKPESA